MRKTKKGFQFGFERASLVFNLFSWPAMPAKNSKRDLWKNGQLFYYLFRFHFYFFFRSLSSRPLIVVRSWRTGQIGMLSGTARRFTVEERWVALSPNRQDRPATTGPSRRTERYEQGIAELAGRRAPDLNHNSDCVIWPMRGWSMTDEVKR